MLSTQDIKNKEVINIYDGRSLGFVGDLDVDPEKGILLGLVISPPRGFFQFFARETEYMVSWKEVRRIGDDVILVESPSLFQGDPQEFWLTEEKSCDDHNI